jgi:glc operon protein GlcG
MKRIVALLIATLSLVGVSLASEPGLTGKKVLSLAGAKAVAASAAAEAKRTNSGGAIAVVDDGGNLLYLERLDGTFPAAANISIGKARSAATFRRETSVFEEAIKNGRTSLVANPDLLPLQGGVPILADGQVVGAVGVAGASSAQADSDIARAAAAAFK